MERNFHWLSSGRKKGEVAVLTYFDNFFNKLNVAYISFVYRTSRINYSGAQDLLLSGKPGKKDYIVSFWHGESYTLYPLLKGKKQFILTTKDQRGNYITALCDHFGYSTIRIPDNTEDGKYISRIKTRLKDEGGGNLVITLDGPLGPYHEPKIFPFFMSLILNSPMISISTNVKHKIRLTKRWDNYEIPLPFNNLTFHFSEPVTIERADIKDHFLNKRTSIRNSLEKNP